MVWRIDACGCVWDVFFNFDLSLLFVVCTLADLGMCGACVLGTGERVWSAYLSRANIVCVDKHTS